MFQTTRNRLALWYTAITAVLLLVFATGVYFYVRYTLIERIDDTLKHVVEVVERSLIIEPDDPVGYHINLEASFRQQSPTVEDDRIDLEFFNPAGELLWSTFSEPLVLPLEWHPRGETVRLGDDYLLRQITDRLEVDRYVLGYLRVSHPWFEVTRPIRKLVLDLSLGIAIMITCGAVIGWLLSGIAIEPVKDSYQQLRQFTADASHELRNPIAMIQTNVQMAITYPDPDQRQQNLKVIERLTQRLGRLVNDLLFLARSDSGVLQAEFEQLPLDALLLEVIEEQRAICRQEKIELQLDIQGDATEEAYLILGDWDQMARLFTNLIGNAIAYAFPGDWGDKPKQITVTMALKEKTGRTTGETLQVTVKDNGIGIPAENSTNIFDRFYRLDPARTNPGESSTGSGLGLAIAAAIAKNHKGKITVESKDQGTTFSVFLPRAT
ncbi:MULTISPECIES: cell wall metabolism sensor histidine kinase WalK [Cyanophyceae]|uniref:sensor histidine kinase n=1 Tax=Cyanophyceae TaxID=3028117 RepID=UPI00016DCB34|nr:MULTISPECIES: HAMP domain-containing sensor histidine kinase [Cyanophyceae]ACA99359.1 two-component sensor histidine kinase [Picosynechococcus sp. PCC 7002]ANV90376.1 two-component sensor histidine kinase [Picosynechococcus sp. PCC 8807]SMH32177.1 two-component system, OmpR family, manganese sensing sensor histidine kinase [Picosynechococcus sp. OG1]SMQ84166.1 two-component system, OmpR family, manganese sensing sensor histidine kinase [Synechococcus sp. 7002]